MVSLHVAVYSKTHLTDDGHLSVIILVAVYWQNQAELMNDAILCN